MNSRIFFALPVLVSILFSGVRSQTAEKPVPMSEEPFHKMFLKNDSIEVFQVRLPVGAMMKFHSHPTDHFAVVISPGQMRNEVIDGRLIVNPPIEPGSVVFLPAGPAHRQSNVDENEIHFIAGELLRKSSKGESAPKSDGCRDLIFDNERIAAYKCVLAPGETTRPVKYSKPFLRVYVSSGKVRENGSATETNKTPGTSEWFASQKRSNIRNAGDEELHLVEIVLK